MASLITPSTLSIPNLNKSNLPNQTLLSNSQLSPSSSQSKLLLRPPKPHFYPTLKLSASSPTLTLLPPTGPIPSISALGLSISTLITQAIHGVSSKIKDFCATPSPEELASIRNLQGNLACAMGPLFFAAMSSPGTLNTPLTVVASGMAKWLEIYSGVLLVRVLLSWFPNIPWDRQPLSAIRDLCDPYLNLFRNIIPPLFDTLDVSPLLAFAVLGTFTAILASSR